MSRHCFVVCCICRESAIASSCTSRHFGGIRTQLGSGFFVRLWPKTNRPTEAFPQWPAVDLYTWRQYATISFISFPLHGTLQGLVIRPELHHRAKPWIAPFRGWSKSSLYPCCIQQSLNQNQKEEVQTPILGSLIWCHIPILDASKKLYNVLLALKRHGVLLEALAVSSFQLLVHLCIVLGPGVGIIHTSLHLAQVTHEVPLSLSCHSFLRDCWGSKAATKGTG